MSPEKETPAVSSALRKSGHGCGARSTELLWRIRALTAVLRNIRASKDEHAWLPLSNAIAGKCPLEIATVVGAAAELSILPSEAQMDMCHKIVAQSDDVPVHAAIWVVRHRIRRMR